MRPRPPESRSDGSVSALSRWLPIAVLAGSLVIFAVLSVLCWVLYDQAEQRLLEERTGEASQVLRVSVGNIQAPLAAAAKLAAATDGDVDVFTRVLADYVGTEPGKPFNAAALYRFGDAEPLATVGDPIVIPADGDNSIASMMSATESEPFVVVDLVNGDRHLGYASPDQVRDPTFVVYGERKLSTNPNVRRQTSEPFAQLDYAIYLNDEQPQNLLGSSLQNDQLPIEGRREAASSPFGGQQLVLVMTPIDQMSSWLFANLWWIVALLGTLLSIGAAWLTRSLLVRREHALDLAADNARLYDEQRHIAETLQLSLLPQELVPPPGGHVTARYWPAGEASLIGGDFYDAFRVDDRRWGVVIGDVCGKGIDAAAITGLVRHTVRAAARNAVSAADVLREVHVALGDHQPSTFCTVCFAYISVDDNGDQTLTVALGGHPAPLLRHADGSVEEIGEPGSLLGIFPPVIADTTVPVASGDTLVLYTDGLTDAPRNQAVPIDELIELLIGEGDEPVELLADSIRPLKRRRRPRGSSDDTAILVLRFGVVAQSDDTAPPTLEQPESAHV